MSAVPMCTECKRPLDNFGLCAVCEALAIQSNSHEGLLKQYTGCWASMDRRQPGMLQPQSEGAQLRRSMRFEYVLLVFLLLLTYTMFQIPAMVAQSGKYTIAFYLGFPLAAAAYCFFAYIWIRVWRRGGIPTVGESKTCQVDYNYFYEDSGNRFRNLLWPKESRARAASSLEFGRAIALLVLNAFCCFGGLILYSIVVSNSAQ